jgi:hypothetical protein
MKAHPYGTAGIVFGVGVVLVIFFMRGSGGGSNQAASDYAAYQQAAAAEAASGNQLAAYQAQTQAASNQVNAETAANANNNSTALSIAQLQSQQATNQADTEAKMLEALAQIQSTTSVTTSTVTAQASEAQTQAGLWQNLFDTLVTQNKPIVTNDTTVYGPDSTTHTLDYSGSYGQAVAGNIGSTPFSISVMPLISPVTPVQSVDYAWQTANSQALGSANVAHQLNGIPSNVDGLAHANV